MGVTTMTHDKIMIQKVEDGLRMKVKYLPNGKGMYIFIGEHVEPEAALTLISKSLSNIRALREAEQ
jgi:hypothetical protein